MEVQSVPIEEQDKLLDECELEGHSLMNLRQRVKGVWKVGVYPFTEVFIATSQTFKIWLAS